MQLLASLLLLTSGLTLTSAAKVVPFSFRAGTPRAQIFDFSKRDTVSVELANAMTQYLVTIQVGNPSQDVLVRIDTGSADLWLMDSSNPFCEGASGSDIGSQYRVDCDEAGLFNPDDSSSWTDNSTEFYIKYFDTTAALGTFGQDDISINGAKISKANFAVGSKANTSSGVFGIGPRYQESAPGATYDRDTGVITGLYDNFPIQMKQQGLISRISYSLYLDHIEENAGTLLFGGVDHAKYKGNLGVVPVLYERFKTGVVPEEPRSLTVLLNGLGIKDDSGNSQWLAEFSLFAILDSGATFSRLPAVIIRPIAEALNASYSYTAEYYLLPCQTAGSIILDFSGVQVEVLVEAMIMPALSTDGGPYTDNAGNPMCYLGLKPYGLTPVAGARYSLGDSILRGLYVVYDLENWEIGIATSDLDSESSDIEEITDGIPRGSSAPSYSAVTASASYSTADEITVFLTNSAGKNDGPISTTEKEGITETENTVETDIPTGSEDLIGTEAPTGTEDSIETESLTEPEGPTGTNPSSGSSSSAKSSSARSSSARSSSAKSSSARSSSARSSSARSSSGTPFGGEGPSIGGAPGAASSFGIAGSAATIGGGGGDSGASKRTANLWLAGLFVFLL